MNTRPYTFYIQPSVINYMYKLLIEGINESFIENGIHMQGTERGGHFCYNKNDNNLFIEITGFIQSSTMPGTTSLNSGDYPFTFHTHPIVINKTEHKIDNYPNLISGEDLIGSIQDNYYYNYKSDRKICEAKLPKNVGGINFFDIVAVPYGLFVYRPIKDPQLMTTPLYIIEKECEDILSTSKDILPEYTQQFERYFDFTTQKSTNAIRKYVTLLRKSGLFQIDFFSWDGGAKRNGIQFVNELPIQPSSIDEKICNC